MHQVTPHIHSSLHSFLSPLWSTYCLQQFMIKFHLTPTSKKNKTPSQLLNR